MHCVSLQKTLLKSELFGHEKGVLPEMILEKSAFLKGKRRHYPTVDYYTKSISLNVSEMVIGDTIIIPSIRLIAIMANTAKTLFEKLL